MAHCISSTMSVKQMVAKLEGDGLAKDAVALRAAVPQFPTSITKIPSLDTTIRTMYGTSQAKVNVRVVIISQVPFTRIDVPHSLGGTNPEKRAYHFIYGVITANSYEAAVVIAGFINQTAFPMVANPVMSQLIHSRGVWKAYCATELIMHGMSSQGLSAILD